MRCLLALGAILLFCVPTAAVTVSVTTQPTPEGPGYITYTLTAESELGDIAGFDFVGDGSLGFFGPMNQINPAGNATIFVSRFEVFDFFGFLDLRQDSHFSFSSRDGLVVNPAEGNNLLQAAMSFGTANAISGPVRFAQIVAPEDAQITYAGNFTVITGSGAILEDVSGILSVPEPTSALLILIGLSGLLATRPRLVR